MPTEVGLRPLDRDAYVVDGGFDQAGSARIGDLDQQIDRLPGEAVRPRDEALPQGDVFVRRPQLLKNHHRRPPHHLHPEDAARIPGSHSR